jgi:hypothetical protein
MGAIGRLLARLERARREPPTGLAKLASVVTKSLYATPESSCRCDDRASIVFVMDVVSIAMALAAFAILLLLVMGIDRI